MSSGDARDGGLTIKVETRGGETEVVVAGEVDLATAPVLADALTRAAEQADEAVVVDLAAVDYLDSSGVHALLEALSATRARDKELRVRGAAPSVLRVLEITGVTAVMTVEPLDP